MVHIILPLESSSENVPALLRDWANRLTVMNPRESTGETGGDHEPTLPFAGSRAGARMLPRATTARRQGLAWWNLDDDPLAGAQAGVPAPVPPPVLSLLGTSKRTYQRGDRILLPPGAVLEVLDGVIALMAVHEDGGEALLGLCGPEQIVVGAEDRDAIQPLAHTNATIAIRPWQTAVKQPEFPERLQRRLRDAEAWAAAQSYRHLDQRLLGTLLIVARQFGVRHAEGVLIDVRLTHAQLASATGATRATVTRVLRLLRKRGLVASVGTGNAERHSLVTG